MIIWTAHNDVEILNHLTEVTVQWMCRSIKETPVIIGLDDGMLPAKTLPELKLQND